MLLQKERSANHPAASGPLPDHLTAALNGLGLGVMTFDAHARVLFANDALLAMLGAPTQARTVLELLTASTLLDSTAASRMHQACLDTVGSGAQRCARADGAACALQMTTHALRDGRWMATFEDVTARDRAEAGALETALRDELTGLPNRRQFHQQLASALGEAGPGPGRGGEAVLLVNLDRFKAVNDTLGHAVGDNLLLLVAKRLRSVLRAEDVVARLGGDEFALLVTRPVAMSDLGELARRVVDMLGRPYLIDGHVVDVGASLGVAVAPKDGRDSNTLLRCADLALHAAKASGHGTFCLFEPEMDTRALARRHIEIDLRRALALREFELHYQPQIDLGTQAVQGFEALLRWRNPERGLVPPAEFVPVAEEIGLIVPLGEWVLRQACREAMNWPGHWSVAVNISPHQFADPARLVQAVARALEASGLPSRRLEVEITETALLRHETGVLAALHGLRDMGVGVAMDDFGTGYSSLSQLRSFPFDRIKIDRSFVQGSDDVDQQNAVIRAITALGASLGMSTIAEGVETPEQLARIRAEGCASVQGYLFGRPVPPAEIPGLIQRITSLDIGRRAGHGPS